MAGKLKIQWRHIGFSDKFWAVSGMLFLIIDTVILIRAILHENYLVATWIFFIGLLVLASVIKWMTTDLHPSIRNR